MRFVVSPICAVAVLVAVYGNVSPQPSAPLDRIVALDAGTPLVLTSITPLSIGALAGAARVPMGLEAMAPESVTDWRVQASGRRLGDVLDALVVADPRYEWRDESGVIVFRTASAWAMPDDPLHRAVGAILAVDIDVGDALRLVGELFDSTLSNDSIPGNRKRFSVNLPPGTRLEALNGIVRAHGAMAWALAPTKPMVLARGSLWYPHTVWLANERSGAGVGVSAYSAERDSIENRVRFGWTTPTGPFLDRMLSTKANGEPVILHRIENAIWLADLANVPMGMELLPAEAPPVPFFDLSVSGMSLRESLFAITTLDPRYDWRDISGVVVLRPVTAWDDQTHPLSRIVGDVTLDHATVTDAVRFALRQFEPALDRRPVFADTASFSMRLRNATRLDVLNAIARSHGGVCWKFRALNAQETKFFEGRQHMLSFSVLGCGGESGFAVP